MRGTFFNAHLHGPHEKFKGLSRNSGSDLSLCRSNVEQMSAPFEAKGRRGGHHVSLPPLGHRDVWMLLATVSTPEPTIHICRDIFAIMLGDTIFTKPTLPRQCNSNRLRRNLCWTGQTTDLELAAMCTLIVPISGKTDFLGCICFKLERAMRAIPYQLSRATGAESRTSAKIRMLWLRLSRHFGLDRPTTPEWIADGLR